MWGRGGGGGGGGTPLKYHRTVVPDFIATCLIESTVLVVRPVEES